MKALGGAESRSYLSRSEDVPNNNYGSNIGHLYYTMACNTLDGQASYACAREKLRANQPPAIHVLARAYAYNSQAVLSQVFKIDREPSRTTALWTQVVPMLSVMRVEGEETEPIRPDLIKAMQQMDTMNVHHSSTDSAWYGFAKIYPDILGERDWVKLYSVTVNEANWYYHLTGKLRILFLEELAKWIESFEEPERTWSLVNSIAGTFAGTFNELKVLVEDMYKQA
jgi:hypothetical protein